VDIEIPPAAEVTDVTETFAGAGAGAGAGSASGVYG
jgi:hypothetical protein